MIEQVSLLRITCSRLTIPCLFIAQIRADCGRALQLSNVTDSDEQRPSSDAHLSIDQ